MSNKRRIEALESKVANLEKANEKLTVKLIQRTTSHTGFGEVDFQQLARKVDHLATAIKKQDIHPLPKVTELKESVSPEMKIRIDNIMIDLLDHIRKTNRCEYSFIESYTRSLVALGNLNKLLFG